MKQKELNVKEMKVEFEFETSSVREESKNKLLVWPLIVWMERSA